MLVFLVDLPGNGNCRFNAVALQLNLKEFSECDHFPMTATSIRSAAVIESLQISDFLDEHACTDWNRCLDSMAYCNTYDDHRTLHVIVEAYSILTKWMTK